MDKCNLLVSYPYYLETGNRLDRWWKEHDHEVNLLIDSGAFTAYRQGKVFELDEYCKFLERLPCRPWGYFQLDVIGDPETSWKNYCTMVERGFEPFPVFQRGEDPAMFEPMFESSDVVAIGGVAGTNGARSVVKELMDKYVKGRRVHWLGFGSTDFIKVFKPYSFDTTNWYLSSSFIEADVYMGGGRFIKFGRTRAQEALTPTMRSKLEVTYGLPSKWFEQDGKMWDNYRGLRALAAAGHTLYMEDLYKQFGTYYFLGVGLDYIWHASVILEAWRKKGTNEFASWVEQLIVDRMDYGQRYGGKND